MSHYNNHQGGQYNNDNHDDEEYDDGYDTRSAYPMQQQMTPQQQRQEERRRHAEQSSASATAAAAAAGKGSSPWLSRQKKKSSKCKTIAWAVLVLLLIAIAGVLAWYFAVYKKNQDNKGSGNSNGGGKTPATGPTGKNMFLTSMAGPSYKHLTSLAGKLVARWKSPPFPLLTLTRDNIHSINDKKEAQQRGFSFLLNFGRQRRHRQLFSGQISILCVHFKRGLKITRPPPPNYDENKTFQHENIR